MTKALEPEADDAREVLGLIVEWYDPQPQLIRQYVLKVFTRSHEVEMVDRKSRKLFLRKTACPPHVTVTDLFVGNRINLFGRVLTIVDYADPYTKRVLQPGQQQSVALITPDVFHLMGKVLDGVIGRSKGPGLQLIKLKMLQLSELQGEELAKILAVTNNVRTFAARMAQGPCVALTIMGEDATDRLTEAGTAMRKAYGSTGSDSVLLWGSSELQNKALSDFLYEGGGKYPTTATFDSCTCAVIRPHAVRGGDAGAIIDLIIEQGYQISAAESFNLDLSAAKEFLEVYKGVVPEYADMAEELTEGPCLALEIRAENAVTTFRQTAGPWDVEIAKEIRPKTLRARFGIDRIRNAVHCTDLHEDGELECRYFFEIIANACNNKP